LRNAGIVSGDNQGLVVRGQRGLFGYSAFGAGELDYRPPRFNTQVYPPQNALATGQLRPYFPYFGGDFVTIPDSRASGIRPALTVQDLSGAYNDWLLGTLPDYQSAEGIPLRSLSEIEELPVALILGGPQTVYNPAILPEFIANDAYAYISAVRPDVAVREFVTAGDDVALALEWDSDDPYNGQIGAGVGGDRPGDYIFLFGGAVIRNDEAGVRSTTGYASIAIVADSGQPAGVYPPFSRPLMTIGGAAIETFFHPTAIRAGQTLQTGDSFIIAGQVAPTILSEVILRITSPSGILREYSGLTNDLGYFYDPANDFIADEPGVWTVELIVAPTDQTIASPRPEGSVPGVVNNTFPVFVLPSNSPSLTWTQGGDTDQRVSPAIPFNFGLNVPAGWRDPQAFVAVTTPSYVLDSGSLRLSGTTVSYQYSAGLLARTFPNLEFEGLGEGASAADVVTLTFVITGMDENDALQIQSRTFTLLHDRLLSVEDASLE
jgi:hypothetical protein